MPKKLQLPRLEEIELPRLREDPGQPRYSIDPKPLVGLTESLEAHGQQTPLVVRPDGEDYVIISGHRRFQAAKLAGLKRLVCVVYPKVTEADVRQRQLNEAIHSEKLRPIEIAMALWGVKQQTKLTSKKLAELVSKLEPWISSVLGVVAGLHEKILLEVQSSKVAGGMDGLIQISRVSDKKKQLQLWKRFKEEPLSLKQLREEVKLLNGRIARPQVDIENEKKPKTDGVDVRFDEALGTSENLEQVIEILRDRYEVKLEEVYTAAGKVFGEDDPDTLPTTSKEEFDEMAHIKVAFDAVAETMEEMGHS